MGFIIKEDGSWDKMGMFDKKEPVIGQEMTYPTSYDNFRHVCRISERVARTWLDDVNYSLSMSHEHDRKDAKPIRPLDNPQWMIARKSNDWLNKMAIVIEVRYHKVFAVYNHDGRYWLIERDQEK